MKAVLQVIDRARLTTADKTVSDCRKGLLVLLGITKDDGEKEADLLIDKILKMRIFPDENGKLNRSALSIGAEILVVSNFTLCASLSSRRPDFQAAKRADAAHTLYQSFLDKMQNAALKQREEGAEVVRVFPGAFGEDMTINVSLRGPITIWVDTEAF